MRLLLAVLFWAAPARAADRILTPVPALPHARAPLAARGWDIWSPAALQLPPQASQAVLQTALNFERPSNHVLLWHKSSGWAHPQGHGPDPERIFAHFADAVDGSLRHALPDEILERQTVQLRYAQATPAAGANVHVDGGYVTVTHALTGPGTLLYPFDNGTPRELAAENGVAIITGLDREQAVGVPATVHAAPPGVMDNRVTVLTRYLRPGFKPGGPGLKQTDEAPAQRTQAVEAYLRSLGRRIHDLGDEILLMSLLASPPKAPK